MAGEKCIIKRPRIGSKKGTLFFSPEMPFAGPSNELMVAYFPLFHFTIATVLRNNLDCKAPNCGMTLMSDWGI